MGRENRSGRTGGLLMRSVRASTGKLGSFFAFYSSALDPDRGEPSMDQRASASSKGGALGRVRWWWVLLTGAGVGVVSYLLLFPVITAYVVILSLFNRAAQSSIDQFIFAYGALGMPTMHLLLTALAASWVARRVGTAAVTHGVLIALVSVVVLQGILLYTTTSLNFSELATQLVMGLGGGLLGGLEGRNVLTGQEALYRASWEISAASDPQAVLNAIHDYLSDPAMAGVALLQVPVRPEDDSPNGAGALENPKPWFSRDWPDDVGFDGLDVPGLAGVNGGRPRTLQAEDLAAPEQAAWKSRGMQSAFLLPLVTPGSARVWLLVVASRKRRLPRSTVRACFTVGAQAALVLENLWLVEEARRAGILRERQRMAHEIHDTLAQGFTSIVMNLEAAEGIMPPTSDRARHHLDQARLTARESLTEARRLVWALRPEALEKASLPEALNRLADRWSKESGVTAGVTVTGKPRPLSPDIEATVFRTAQEALANVRKHADASRVALTLSYMGDTLALDARDNGVGFDPSRTAMEARDRTSGGFGLKGMRERIEQAGGSLSVESAPGEGSTLAVELPMIAPEGGSPESGGPEPLRVEPAGRVP